MVHRTEKKQLFLRLDGLGMAFCVLMMWGNSARAAQRPATRRVVSSLDLAHTKVPPATLISARNKQFAAAGNVDGDTFDAAGSAQDSTTAWFVDDLPDSHTFGTGPETAGMNLLSNIDMRIVGTDFGPGIPDTNLLQVNYYTVDGSDIVPAGSISPNAEIYDSWRLDVGSTSAGTDKIELTPNPGFTVVDSGFCVFNNGNNLGCVDLALDDSSANGVSGVGASGLNGADIAGYGVDELVMYWEIQIAPSCGDGHVDMCEECDDGNIDDGDGCSATCQIESPIAPADLDGDGDVDLRDQALFLQQFTGP